MAIVTYTDKYTGRRVFFDNATEQVAVGTNNKGEPAVSYKTYEGPGSKIVVPVEPIV